MNWREVAKVELHLHLDGSVRPRTLWELLQQHRAAGDEAVAAFAHLKTEDELRAWVEVGDECDTLADYLARFELPLAVMQNAAAMERIAYELVEDLAAENVRYAEVRFAPILHTRGALGMGEAAAATVAGLRRGEADFGVKTGVIACCMRHVDPADNVAMVREVASLFGKGVVAIDLAGDEAAFPAKLHKEAFTLARDIGFHITVHAGEAGGADEMRYALEVLGAERIGHGVRMEDDADLMAEIIRRGIALDMCPSSNVQTKTVASLADHPLCRYMDEGARITISTDNRTVSATTLAQEYERVVAETGCTPELVLQSIEHAAAAAFLPPARRKALVAEIREHNG